MTQVRQAVRGPTALPVVGLEQLERDRASRRVRARPARLPHAGAGILLVRPRLTFRRPTADAEQAEHAVEEASAPAPHDDERSMKAFTRSIGIGKRIVELFEALISSSVCR